MGCGASSKGRYKDQPQAAHASEPDQSRDAPPEKIRAIRMAFAAIDVDGTGTIDASELESMLTKLEGQGHTLSTEEKENIFNFIDVDKSGTIQLGEFICWVLEQDVQEGKEDSLAKWATHEGILGIHEAAMKGDVDKVKECMAAGSNVNVGDVGGVTPLHFAARCGHAEVVGALLEAKADAIATTAKKGITPLHAAAAATTSPDIIIGLLLAAGAQVKAVDGDANTALHTAAQVAQLGAVGALLNAGAGVNEKSVAGKTALHLCVKTGAGAVAEALIAAKADVNMQANDSTTALHIASGSGASKAVELLLAAGSDANFRDRGLLTPLHYAVRSSKNDTATILLNAKADINAKSSAGYTPLGMSEEWSSSSMRALLQNAGGMR